MSVCEAVAVPVFLIGMCAHGSRAEAAPGTLGMPAISDIVALCAALPAVPADAIALLTPLLTSQEVQRPSPTSSLPSLYPCVLLFSLAGHPNRGIACVPPPPRRSAGVVGG